jgi:cytochrome c-type biogenesis protein CcmE
MPKEVADALKKQGHWKDDYDKQGKSAKSPAKPGNVSMRDKPETTADGATQ